MILGSFKKRQSRQIHARTEYNATNGRKQGSQKTRVRDENMLFAAPNHRRRDGVDYIM